MNHIFFFLFLFWLSFIVAKLEIEIEGEFGWAEKLPTWRLSREHWISKVFFGGRPATGYHVWVNLLILSFVHIIFVFTYFSWAIEIKIISFFILFWVLEDFLWFVLNPKFSIRNFKRDKIWWHAHHWWFIAPAEYFIFVPIGIILYLI